MPHRPTLLPQRPVPRAAGLPSGVGSGIGLSLGVGLGLLVGLPGLGLAPAPALARPFPRALAQQPPPQERGASEPGGLPATVLSVGDGDTLRVNQAGQVLTIRLACIDAPEMAQRPWGEASRAYLQARLPRGTTVSLLLHTIDRYGRTVAEVIHEININLVLVEDGQAFAYRRYLGSCDAREYIDAEFRASRHRAGVWQLPGGITRPWLFRQLRRGQGLADRAPQESPPGDQPLADRSLAAGLLPEGRRWSCRRIGSWQRAQELLRQGHWYLDGDGDGEACERPR